MRARRALSEIEEMDVESLQGACDVFGKLSGDFERALSQKLTGGAAYSVALRRGLQNKQFMIDLIPTIQAWMKTLPFDTRLSVLDVGPSWALGTNFLASMYHRPYLGYQLDVTAIDIREIYRPYVKAFCPYITYRVEDLFKLSDTFDISICSHVLEHVPNPVGFLQRLREVTKRRVFFASPFEEESPRATNHINYFDRSFLSDLEAENVQILESPGWGPRSTPPKKMFIAELPGSE